MKRQDRTLVLGIALLVVGGCSTKSPAEKMEDLIDRMCSCTSLDCRVTVLDESTRLVRASTDLTTEEERALRERQRALDTCLHPDPR